MTLSLLGDRRLLILVLGLALFILVHLIPASPDLRRALATRFGENAYKGVFSLVSLIGFALIVYGYHKIQLNPGKNPVLWDPPSWGRHVTMALMLPVFPLLLATYFPGRISAAVGHPMITAVKLWALAHLFVRGDMASMILFATLLAWAVYDRISLKGREPDGRALRGRGSITGDLIAVVGGLALYGAFVVWGHKHLIGIALAR